MHRLPLLLILPLVLLACRAGNPLDPVPRKLVLTVSTFEDVVRWGDLRKMYAFAKPGASMQVQPRLSNVRVTHYEEGQLSELAPWRWGQSVVISYVLKDRQVVRQLLDQQVWVSDDEGKTWFRDTPIPQF